MAKYNDIFNNLNCYINENNDKNAFQIVNKYFISNGCFVSIIFFP